MKKIAIKTIFTLLGVLAVSTGARAASWEPTTNQTKFLGEQHRLIILVEMKDRPFVTPDANAAFTRQFNQDGYSEIGCVGSVRDFLIDNSGGKFRPTFHILGPVMLPEPMYDEDTKVACYYRDNGLMVAHAVVYAKKMYSQLDFSMFDNDKDGTLDPIMVYHPGKTDDPHSPWPHASGINGSGWSVNGWKQPGIEIGGYAVSPERAPQGTMAGYTLFLHEFGHTLGLPDDYSGRLGRFSIYCDGTFNGGIIPVNFNAAERLILGWLDYEVIDKDGEYTLQSLSKNKALMLKTENPDEYFLFSNRDNSGADTPWDSYFGFGGMLVWHIDRSQNKVTNEGVTRSAINMWYGNQPNGSPDHPCHKLIDADGRNLPYAGNYRNGMYFPAANMTRLNSTTHSHFKTWAGLPLGVDIYDIKKEANNDITFKVKFSGNAALKVSVTDDKGVLLTDTHVSVAAVGLTGEKLTGNTELTGICTFSDLTPGSYEVLVDKEGYAANLQTKELLAGSNLLEVKLQPGDEGIQVERIEFDYESIDIAVGQTKSIYPNVYPLTAGNRRVTWESGNAAIARIDAEGKLKGVSAGTATITATSVKTPAVSASLTVNVAFGQEAVIVTPYQRDAKVLWPGYNPDSKWKVSWRVKGTAEYVSSPEQTPVSLYLGGLTPATEYEGKVESASDDSISPVGFVFVTGAETFDFPVIYLAKSRYSNGDIIPLVVNNTGTADYTIRWKVNNTPVEGGEYIPSTSGTCELRAEVTFGDGSTEVLIKELQIL